MRIAGEVFGPIWVTGPVRVEPHGVVRGEVRVERLQVESAGVVEGDVRASSVVVAAGGRLRGTLWIAGGEDEAS